MSQTWRAKRKKPFYNLFIITLAMQDFRLRITRGSGVRLKQGHVINNAICNLLKYRVPQQWNNLPLNIVQCTNFTSFKSKLFVYLQENDTTFFKF